MRFERKKGINKAKIETALDYETLDPTSFLITYWVVSKIHL